MTYWQSYAACLKGEPFLPLAWGPIDAYPCVMPDTLRASANDETGPMAA